MSTNTRDGIYHSRTKPDISNYIAMIGHASSHVTSPNSFLITPSANSPRALGGLLKLNGLRGGERDVLNPAGVALVSLEKHFLMLDLVYTVVYTLFIHMSYFVILVQFYFCTTIFSHPTFFCRHCLCCWCWHRSSPRIEKWKQTKKLETVVRAH